MRNLSCDIKSTLLGLVFVLSISASGSAAENCVRYKMSDGNVWMTCTDGKTTECCIAPDIWPNPNGCRIVSCAGAPRGSGNKCWPGDQKRCIVGPR